MDYIHRSLGMEQFHEDIAQVCYDVSSTLAG
jgi:hypothetical protein